MARVKKGDTIIVVAGKDKGKRSTVIRVHPIEDQALVKDVAMVTRHTKPRRQGEQGGIKTRESYIDLCKLMPVCASCNKPCRVNVRALDDGKHVRVCNKCKEIF
jgi:large subunit ribosomal protein L24